MLKQSSLLSKGSVGNITGKPSLFPQSFSGEKRVSNHDVKNSDAPDVCGLNAHPFPLCTDVTVSYAEFQSSGKSLLHKNLLKNAILMLFFFIIWPYCLLLRDIERFVFVIV